MIAIVDYGVGNLFSLQSSFAAIGSSGAVVARTADALEKADKIVLPGVGAFGDASAKLRGSGMLETLLEQVNRGNPLLGICLGMQLLFDRSFEYGEHEGLGLIPGEVRPLSEAVPTGLKIPHMGWNALRFTKQSSLFRYIEDGDFVYFVHSYHGALCGDHTIALTDYGAPVTAAVQKDNVFGCQFHPEKSGNTGLKILKAFAEM